MGARFSHRAEHRQPRLAAVACVAALFAGGARAEVGVLPTGDDALTAALHAGASSTADEPLMEDDRLAKQIEAAEQLGVTCAARAPDCLARLAGLASLSAIVVTRIEGDTMVLTLVDATEKAVVARAAGALSESREETARNLAARLFTEDARRARLRVVVTPAEATVTVDGEPRSVGEVIATTPGRHLVRAEAVGFVAVERELEVELGDAVDVELRLDPSGAVAPVTTQPEPGPPLLLWVGVGGIAAGAVIAVAGGAGIATGAILAEIPSAATDLREPLHDARGLLVVATVAGVTLAALGGATVGIALLTDP